MKKFLVAEETSQLPVDIKAASLVLGNLDGLHLGHQELIRRALSVPATYCMAFTFDPHPLEILKPGGQFQRIFPKSSQIQLMEKLGLDGVYYQKFTPAFSQTSAEEFLENHIYRLFDPTFIVVGFNFRFGKDRQGTPEMLRDWAKTKPNLQVEVVDPVSFGEQVVSSSEIRRSLLAGNVKRAGELLGFPFFLDAKVEEGAKRGRQIGYPTANMSWPTNALTPKFGVYVTRSTVGGVSYPSVSHIGPIPTFEDNRPRLETHIFDQDLSLYGLSVKVEFIEHIRDPIKFDGLESLKKQIQKDSETARRIHAHDTSS